METQVAQEQNQVIEEQVMTCRFCNKGAVASVADIHLCKRHITVFWGMLGNNVRKADHFPGDCYFCQSRGLARKYQNVPSLCADCLHVCETMNKDGRFEQPIIYLDEEYRLEEGHVYVLTER